ncbi:hypothetical protein EV359DRAFT_68211 [Lentinula novae-zelandiae]|nr:hypothetical protein EV359DRAFT_68211 [Lentinula novae-zelandiae]
MFNSNNPSEESLVDLSIIAEASRKAALAVLQPADHIEVFQSEQSGVRGIVQEIQGERLSPLPRSVEIWKGKRLISLQDHVKVMQGKNAGEIGLVVAVSDTGSTPSTSNVNAAFLGFHRRTNFGRDRTSFAASGRNKAFKNSSANNMDTPYNSSE